VHKKDLWVMGQPSFREERDLRNRNGKRGRPWGGRYLNKEKREGKTEKGDQVRKGGRSTGVYTGDLKNY